jgi:hypothetical protein
VSHSLRTLDDGAWVSVDDRREASASELWCVRGVCDCAVGDLLVEGIVAVGADGRTVTARVAGRCLGYDRETVMGHLPVGRVVEGSYRPLAAGAVRAPPGAEQPALFTGSG